MSCVLRPTLQRACSSGDAPVRCSSLPEFGAISRRQVERTLTRSRCAMFRRGKADVRACRARPARDLSRRLCRRSRRCAPRHRSSKNGGRARPGKIPFRPRRLRTILRSAARRREARSRFGRCETGARDDAVGRRSGARNSRTVATSGLLGAHRRGRSGRARWLEVVLPRLEGRTALQRARKAGLRSRGSAAALAERAVAVERADCRSARCEPLLRRSRARRSVQAHSVRR